eukprot:scaffold477225_cov33-Prasinocladus_malaysianus.AAC.1
MSEIAPLFGGFEAPDVFPACRSGGSTDVVCSASTTASTSACTTACTSPYARRSSSFSSRPTLGLGNGMNGSGLADLRAQLDFLDTPELGDHEQALHLKRVRSLASASRRLRKTRSDR